MILITLALALLVVAAAALKNVVIAHPDGPRWVYAILAVSMTILATALLRVARRGWRSLS